MKRITTKTEHFQRCHDAGIFISLMAFSQLASAAGEEEPEVDIFWLYALPDWALFALSIGAFIGGFLLLAWVSRRWLVSLEGVGKRVDYYAAAMGVAVGIIAGLFIADMKQAYWFDAINALPPTAAGHPPASTPAGALFEDSAAEVPGQLKTGPRVKNGRGRAVQVNQDLLNQDSLVLNLFEDVSLVAVKERVVIDENGMSWIGRIEGAEDSEVILSLRGKAMMGTVRVGQDAYDIVYAGNGVHVVRQVDPNAEAPHSEPIPVSEAEMAAELASGGTALRAPAVSGDTGGAVIDLMVLYTAAAKNNAGGQAGIEAKILNAVAAANQAYLNSQVAQSLHLVHMEEIAYTQTGNMSTTLADLAGTADGKMDNIHALRDQYGADQVVLISSESNYCGIAYQMQSLGTWFAPYAFAVVHDDSIYSCLGNQTMAHEMGHNQGNAHDAQNSVNMPGIAAYSYGYRVCGVFRTVMSYQCSGEPRISSFANPNILYAGQPTGITDSADTVRSMNQAAATVAAFRAAVAAATPNAPGSLAAAVASASAINLSWADNSTDEQGFKVQRSGDGGVTWSEIASLGSNTTAFSSTGLSAGTGYSYRVYGYNSAGNSAFSNMASATTTAPVLDTAAPVVSISSPSNGATVPSGTVKVNVSATDNQAVSSLKLLIDGKPVATVLGTSLSYSWNTRKLSAGSHAVSAEAVDPSGNKGTQAITVKR
jgi:hypothetical protein